MKCWKCGSTLEDLPTGKLAFRAICDDCFSWLHCCKNCTHYQPGKPNDCTVPGTEYIADREASNFCEEFTFLGKGPQEMVNPDDVAKKLFGDSEGSPKKSFENLFGDE